MASDLSIACTLGARQLPERLAEIRDLGRRALIGVDRQRAGAVLRFRADSESRDRLGAIVAAEARCCAFLEMTLFADGDAVALSITAPPGAEPVLEDLVAAFAGAHRAL